MPVAGFIFDIRTMHINLWSVFKNVLLVTIASNEIKCADRIVYETGIYEAVVESARASECFFFSKYWRGKINILIGSDIAI